MPCILSYFWPQLPLVALSAHVWTVVGHLFTAGQIQQVADVPPATEFIDGGSASLIAPGWCVLDVVPNTCASCPSPLGFVLLCTSMATTPRAYRSRPHAFRPLAHRNTLPTLPYRPLQPCPSPIRTNVLACTPQYCTTIPAPQRSPTTRSYTWSSRRWHSKCAQHSSQSNLQT